MDNVLNVILVEDSVEDTWMILHEFSMHGVRICSEKVQTAGALVEALERRTWDLVISDYRMPRFSGMMALAVVRLRHPRLPFILLSGCIEEKSAKVAVQSGATAVLMKNSLHELVWTVKREIKKSLPTGIKR